MNKRLLSLYVALILLLCGCGSDTPQEESSSDHPISSAVTFTTTSTVGSTSVATAPSQSDPTTTSPDISTPTTLHTTAITQTTTTQATSTIGNTSTAATTTITTAASTATTASPTVTTFTATVRNDQRQLVGGVTVFVWASADVLLGHAITDNKGVARILLENTHSPYRVTLSNLPTGYEADSEYRFSTTTVNITIRKAAVQNELDHSNARYEKGQKMTDFSLTDIDGNTYRLSTLLSQKQLVIIDFWYTTCQPCKMEFPYFESAVGKYGDKFSLLAVNPINDNQAMAALRQQLNASPATTVSFPMLKDTCNLYLGFDVSAYPTTVFIDANGMILDIHQGAYASEEAFLAAIERYLH